MTFVLFQGPDGSPLYVVAENVQAIGVALDPSGAKMIGVCVIHCQGGVSAMAHMTVEAAVRRLVEATDGSVVKLSPFASGDVN